MAADQNTLNGYLKQAYGELSRAVPRFAILQKETSFENADKLGDFYNFPVVLRGSHGVTFGGSSATAFNVAAPITYQTFNAQVRGSQMVLAESIAYGMVSRTGDQVRAFGTVAVETGAQMMEAARFYNEFQMLYGASLTGLGVVTTAGASATTVAYVITLATWANGIWSQMENANVDVYDPTLVTRRNAIGALQVSAIVQATRTVSLTGAAADNAAVLANDVLVPRNAITGGVMTGLDAIMTNTGTLFNISSTTFSLWRAGIYPVGSATLNMQKIQAAASQAVGRGLDEDVICYMSQFAWTDMNNDLTALRRFADNTRSGVDVGTERITYHGVSGKITLVAHPMIKAGEAFMGPASTLHRIGSTDLTFRLRGLAGQEDKFYFEDPATASFNLRLFSDQAIIIDKPARWVKFTNIVNQSI